MNKIKKFNRWVFKIILLQLLLFSAFCFEVKAKSSYFEMEVKMEDAVLPYTPIPVEVVITNVSGRDLPVAHGVRRANESKFSLKMFNEEGDLIYEGPVSGSSTPPPGLQFRRPPYFIMEPSEELLFDFRLDVRGREESQSFSEYRKSLPHYLFSDAGEYRLQFEYRISFYKEAFEDLEKRREVRKRESLQAEAHVNAVIGPKYEEAFEAVRNLSRHSRAGLFSLRYAIRLVREDLLALQRRERTFADEESMEKAIKEKIEKLEPELTKFLEDYGDSPWAPYAWYTRARIGLGEIRYARGDARIALGETVLEYAQKALALAHKHELVGLREKLEPFIENIEEGLEGLKFRELFFYLGRLDPRADEVSGMIYRLEPPRRSYRPGQRPIRGRMISRKVDDVSAYMEQEPAPSDVAFFFHYDDDESLTAQGEKEEIPTGATFIMGDPEGGFVRAPVPPEQSGYREAMDFLREAPEGGYENRMTVTASEILEQEGLNVYFYFKMDGQYGKGSIGRISGRLPDEENFNLFRTLTFHVNPTEGDRNLRHIWHWDEED